MFSSDKSAFLPMLSYMIATALADNEALSSVTSPNVLKL